MSAVSTQNNQCINTDRASRAAIAIAVCTLVTRASHSASAKVAAASTTAKPNSLGAWTP